MLVCPTAPRATGHIVQRCAFTQTHRSITPARCSDGLDTRPPWRTDACSSGPGPARFRHRAGHFPIDATIRALHVLAHQLQRCCGCQHMPGTDRLSRAISNMGSRCTLGPGSDTQAIMCAFCALRCQRLHPPACGTFLLPWHVVQRLCACTCMQAPFLPAVPTDQLASACQAGTCTASLSASLATLLANGVCSLFMSNT